MSNNNGKIGVSQLTFMAIISIVSLRNVPLLASYGYDLFGLIFISATVFLLPAALVSAILAENLPSEQGIFSWVSETFGRSWGLLAAWLQWMSNLFWFPLMLSQSIVLAQYFLSSIGLPVPILSKPSVITVCVMAIFAWLTHIAMGGLRLAAEISKWSTYLGLLAPTAALVLMGVVEWVWPQPEVDVLQSATATSWLMWSSHFTTAMGALMGIELMGVHMQSMEQAHRDFPKVILAATCGIIALYVCSAGAILLVIPAEDVDVLSGAVQTFDIVLSEYHLQNLLPVFIIALILGNLGAIVNWIIAPAQSMASGLIATGTLAALHPQPGEQPRMLLMTQMLLVSGFSIVLGTFPSLGESYQLLNNVAAQAYLLMYMMMFVVAVILARSANQSMTLLGKHIPAKIVIAVAMIGFFGSLLGYCVGFIPLEQASYAAKYQYVISVAAINLLILSGPAWLLLSRPNSRST